MADTPIGIYERQSSFWLTSQKKFKRIHNGTWYDSALYKRVGSEWSTHDDTSFLYICTDAGICIATAQDELLTCFP